MLLILSATPADSSIQAFHRSFGPTAKLLVASPTLLWEVWPSSGARVTSVSMSVNGSPVNANYNPELRRVEYQPEHPLGAGNYNVACRVKVDDYLTVKKDWSFQVSSGAVKILPAPDAAQDQAVREVSRIRAELGLPKPFQEDRFNAASFAHSKYLTLNKRTGHFEQPGEPGFVASTPSQRLEVYGYSGGSWECVTYNSGGIRESIQDLFDAPYHRIPFLQPGRMPIGSGVAGRNFTLKFGNGEVAGPSYSPGNGQRYVPTSWNANETPNPLRVHMPLPRRVGYPIVFSYFADESPTLKVVKAELSRDGVQVPVFVNSKANDDRLDNTVFIIPTQPLKPNERYTVYFEGTVNDKSRIRHTWSFETGPQ
jgi:hypothetical protein